MSTDLVHYGDGPSNCPACITGRYGGGKNLRKIEELAAEHLAAQDLMALKSGKALDLNNKLTEFALNSRRDLVEDAWTATNRSTDEEIREMHRNDTAALLGDHLAAARALLDGARRSQAQEAQKSVIPEPHYQEGRRRRK